MYYGFAKPFFYVCYTDGNTCSSDPVAPARRMATGVAQKRKTNTTGAGEVSPGSHRSSGQAPDPDSTKIVEFLVVIL